MAENLEPTIISERIIVNDGGTHSISGCTFNNCINQVTGGAFAYGGAIGVYKGEMTVSDVTFAGNTAQRGGGIAVGDGDFNTPLATVNIINSEFLGNKASSGGYVGSELFVNGDGTANVTDSRFVGTVCVQGYLNINGTVSINGEIYHSNRGITLKSGATLVLSGNFRSTANAVFTVESGSVIEFANTVVFMELNGSNSVKDLSNAALKVGSALLTENGKNLASGIFSVDENTRTIIGGNTVKIGNLAAASANRIGVVKYDASKLVYNSSDVLTLADAASGDFIITDFAAAAPGLAGYTGLINVTGGTHTIANWNFLNNTSAALTVSGGTVVVENSTFTDNTSSSIYSGQALNVSGAGAVIFKNSVANDSVCANGDFYVDGVSTFNEMITNYNGSITVKSGATMKIGQEITIYQHKGITFENGAVIEFDNTALFRDTGGNMTVVQDLSNAVLKVGSSIVSDKRLASNVSCSGGETVVIGGNSTTLGKGAALNSKQLGKVDLVDNNLQFYVGNATLSSANSGGFYAANWTQLQTDFAGYDGRVIAADGSHTISNCTFSGNTTSGDSNWGGAIAVRGGTLTIDNVTFSNNKADRGGAVYVKTGATANILNSEFSNNSASLGGDIFVEVNSVANVTDTTFGGAIAVQGALTFNGDVALKNSIYHYNGSITIGENGTLSLDESITINTSIGLSFAENSTLEFNSRGVLVRSSGGVVGDFVQDLAGANVTVTTDAFLDFGVSTFATGVKFGENQTVGFDGGSYKLGEEFEYRGNKFVFKCENDIFTGRRLYDTVYASFDGAAEVVVGGETIALNGKNAFTDIASAENNMAAGGKLVICGKDFGNPETVTFNAAELVVTGECAGEATVNGGTAHLKGNVSDNVKVTFDNMNFTGDCLYVQNAQDISGDWDVAFNKVTAVKIVHYQRGYFYLADNANIGGNVNVSVANDTNIGRIYVLSGTTNVTGDVNVTLDDSHLVDGHLTLSGGKTTVGGSVNIVLQQNSSISGDIRGTGSDVDSTVSGDVNITISNSSVGGNVYGGYGHTVNGNVGIALAGAMVTGSIYKSKNDQVSGSMNITVNGANNSVDTLIGVDTLIFNAGAKLALTTATDLSDALITVDGSQYAGNAITIATGVSVIGEFTITDKANAFLTLEVVDGNLVLKEVAEETITGTSHTGNGLTNMDSGEVGTLFATKDNESEIATKISGGKVESNLVGGAYVAAGNTAEVDKVELLIGGTAEVAAKVYAGGYLYGNGAEAAEAQLTVGEVNITLDGGAVSTNMYGGAHARQNGNAKVDTVNITVTDGSHGRIYAGGWAEKGAVSSVGIANVTISGGTVDYLYGAGANADGKTYVTTTNITIENDAVVNTIFMGGRYGYSWVDNVNMTFAGADKVLNRLSGVSSAGMDYAKATVVELETNVTADLIDYVDKFVINEGYTLTANNEFYLGNRVEGGAEPDVTTFDFIAEGEAEWTAVAGIDDFTNAKFAVNGSEAQLWDGKSAIAIGGYELTYDAKDKTIKLAQITA